MSKPDIVPKTSTAGIAVDPNTLDRVIPESRRPDGSVRKQLRVRPGFTPQEDIGRFRGSRQQQHDQNQLPKGHILGWIAPSSETQKKRPGIGEGGSSVVGAGDVGGGEKPMTKSAAKNAKRKAKKQAEKEKTIREAWDEDSDEDKDKAKSATTKAKAKTKSSDEAAADREAKKSERATTATSGETKETPAAVGSGDREGDALAEELEKKLDVH